MKAKEPSQTAEFNALFRALESLRLPRRRRLFNDPLARGFLSTTKWAYLVFQIPFFGRLIPSYIDFNWPGVRPSALGRTCWIDEQLVYALKNKSIWQVVILGAGYDCRAYRIPGMDQTRVFEIDHPNTLAVKVKCLKEQLGSIPGHVSFVNVDFDLEDFVERLENSGFDRSIPTFFLWEGVMHYLTSDAVDKTLREIAYLSAPQSRLVFTYIHRGLLDGTESFGDMRRIPSTLKESSEVWKFGLKPEELPSFLARYGFSLTTDISSVEYRARYMGDSGGHLKGFEFYRAALAEMR